MRIVNPSWLFLLPLFLSISSAFGADPRLVFYESFDSAASIAANGGSCSGGGCNLVAGKIGSALDSVGSVLSYPTANHFNRDKGTVRFWFKPNDSFFNRNDNVLSLFDWKSGKSWFTIMRYYEAPLPSLLLPPSAGVRLVARYDDNAGTVHEAGTSVPSGLGTWQTDPFGWHKIDVYWDTQAIPPYITLALDDTHIGTTNYKVWGGSTHRQVRF